MNLEQRIDLIYEKMQNTALSNILPLVLPISLHCKDYKGYCILQFWGRPHSTQKSGNLVFSNELHKILSNEELDSAYIDKIIADASEEYLGLRSIGKDKVMGYSIKEMEDKINYCNDVIAAIEPNPGLAPIDLYYTSAEATKGKFSILESRKQLEEQCSVLQAYIVSKLTEYRRTATLEERKQQLKNNIKNSKDIFIIHGHNEAKRRELEALLKDKFGLNPIVLLDQADQGLTIIEKFEKYATTCSYAFALFTPDDIVTNGEQQYFQARPNVIFELGWFYANLGRSRVCILDQESEQSKIFSDLQGILRMQFKENISERYMEIERELKSVGII